MATAKYVKFLRGTPDQFKNLTSKNEDTLYFISKPSDTSVQLYLGNKLIANGNSGGGGSTIQWLNDLSDVEIENLQDSSFLVYDNNSKAWINKTPDELIFIGSTDISGGTAGLVPAPPNARTDLFLRSDGEWGSPEVNAIIITITNEEKKSHSEIIEEEADGFDPSNGDIIIIKDIIVIDENNNSNNKYQHTAYVYSDGVWAAMDGNYNAENVYFKDNFTFTKPVGVIEIPSSGSTVVEAAGKNLKEFLTSIFTEELDPTVTQPSVSFSSVNSGSYEVGTSLVPSYTLSFDEGTYSYDNSTGVTATKYIVKDSKNVEFNTITGAFPSLLIVDNMNYQITAYAEHSAGDTPHTNVGNLCDNTELAIVSGNTESIVATYTGYRPFYYGIDESAEDITADVITGLKNGGNYNKQYKLIFTASDKEKPKRFIIAVPSTNTRAGLKSATITSSMNANATDDYKFYADAVTIKGSNGIADMNYNLWVYQPASIASVEVHEVILS